jgi:hypothetical protein
MRPGPATNRKKMLAGDVQLLIIYYNSKNTEIFNDASIYMPPLDTRIYRVGSGVAAHIADVDAAIRLNLIPD